MGRKSEIAQKIQLLANRIRCSTCNATSEEALFIIEEDIKFRSSSIRPKLNKPMFKSPQKKLRMNRTQILFPAKNLVRICVRCGGTRKTGIPNTCTLEYD